jgi:hypothetical protein
MVDYHVFKPDLDVKLDRIDAKAASKEAAIHKCMQLQKYLATQKHLRPTQGSSRSTNGSIQSTQKAESCALRQPRYIGVDSQASTICADSTQQLCVEQV